MWSQQHTCTGEMTSDIKGTQQHTCMGEMTSDTKGTQQHTCMGEMTSDTKGILTLTNNTSKAMAYVGRLHGEVTWGGYGEVTWGGYVGRLRGKVTWGDYVRTLRGMGRLRGETTCLK